MIPGMSKFSDYVASRKTTPTLVDAAIAMGIPVFPCDAQKRPLTAHGFKDATSNPDELRRIFANPKATMIGMPTGEITGVVVIDVDVKDGRPGMEWLNENSHRLPQTRTIRTGSGGLHIYLRWPGQMIRNSAGKIAPGIDIRGDGGYVVVSPSPGYAVADDSEVSGVPDWLMPILVPPAPPERTTAPTHAPLPPRPHNPDGGTHYGVAALERECDAIRQSWEGSKHHTLNKAAFSIGGLVSAGELQEGFAFAELSAALSDIRHACKDFRHAQNTLRTAFQDGTQKPRDVPERMASIPDDAPHPAAAFLAKIFARGSEKQKAPLPVGADLMDVPGALKMFIEHCEATAISPQPFLALAAAITLVGTLAGRRYRTITDLRTNIYSVGIADSGAGKDHARKVIKKCLHAADLGQYMGGSDIASGSGLRTALLRHPAMLFQIDEFGDWLAGVVSDKAGSHRKQIAAMLKELYSSASGQWQGTEYADQSKMGRPREDIYDPHACFYGTTTPEQFWGAVAGANLRDGLLARMLLFVTPCSYPDEREPTMIDPPQALIDALQAIARGAGTGNLSDLMMSSMPATVTTVLETPQASDARRAMRHDQLQQQREAEGTYVTAIAGRLAENAMKLALIRAVARDPASPIIDVTDIAWGRAVAQHCVDTLLRDAGRHVGDTDFERKMNLAADIIRKHGPIGASEMIGKGFRFSAKERGEIIETLLTGGIISAAPTAHKGAGRPSVKYVIAV
jgi:hypothetical protein